MYISVVINKNIIVSWPYTFNYLWMWNFVVSYSER